MRTVFVNPSASFSNPRKRRRRRAKAVRRAAPRRRRRRNAGITPFVSSARRHNPLILENPRRRRRRRNPGFAGMNLNKMVSSGINYLGGAGIGAAANIFGLRRIENDWARNGARLGVAIIGAPFLGDLGGPMAGATLYPLFAELALMLKLVQPAEATEADLTELAADLEDVLDELEDEDEELFS